MDSIGSFDKMKLVVMYNPEDSQEDKTECIIKKFMRLPKQRVMQLYCLVRPYFRKRKVQYQQRHCDGVDAIR